jgi:alkanesulfonate monooxygenase SsuD/methylene tetrahydromethanopterin reductase-like flavin-dependent oxidoreductase (luciferase family)
MNFLYCHEDRKHAAQVGLEMVRNFNYLNTHCLWNKEVYPTPSYKTLSNLAPGRAKAPEDPSSERPVPEGVTIGDPQDVIRAIKEWESTGVDSVNFMINSCEIIDQQAVLESLRLFAREVMPAFKSTTAAEREAA